jgi:alpha-beta hydrolase superfamily lysophospholipase
MQQLETVGFEADGYRLKGTYHLPSGNPARPPVVIGSHGLFSSGNSPKQLALARHCNALGIAFFRIDHRGCGESQGLFSHVTSLEARSNDLISAVETIVKHSGNNIRIGLFGSSLGGAACLYAASRVKAAALVTYAAPLTLKARISVEDLPPELRLKDRQARPFPLAFDIRDQVSRIKNILIVHGDADTVVPYSDAVALYRKVKPPKQLVRQAGGDHPMSRPSHQLEFVQAAANWFRDHL